VSIERIREKVHNDNYCIIVKMVEAQKNKQSEGPIGQLEKLGIRSYDKVYSQGSGKMNEDEYLLKDNLFVVFDGATSLIPFMSSEGKTGGRLAAEIARKEFSKDGESLFELAENTNNVLVESMRESNIDTSQKEALWMVGAAAVKIHENEIEYFQISDCHILTILKDDTAKLLVDVIDHDLETMKMWKEAALRNEEGNLWEELKPQINKVRRQANIDYGFLNGEKEAVKFFKYGKVKRNNIKSIILFTDGMLIPKTDPEGEEDWNLFAKIYQEKGLTGVLEHVRSTEDSDSKCRKYPRFKIHDDIAAVSIDLD
jgi:hypothetical protein